MDQDRQPAVGIVDSPSLPTYDLGQDHVFARHRQLGLFDLLQRMELFRPDELLSPPTAPEAALLRVHDADYLELVAAVSASPDDPAWRHRALAFGLGTADNPICAGQHEAAAAVCGATLHCVEEVLAGRLRHAFNPAGGLHHAQARAASGFCIYNDLAVGIAAALEAGLERVLYIDFDVHHGDGVEFLFAADPRVMTLSLHQSPDTLFPGTGRVSDMGQGTARGSIGNLPLAPYTGDASWWACVEGWLPRLVREFRPQLILSQHGCDPHALDPLAQVELSTGPMHRAAALCKDLAEEVCEGRWVATGGGGYQPLRVIPRAWGLVWLAMSGRPVPAGIDAGWLERWAPEAGGPLEPGFFDPPLAPTRATQEAARINEATLDRFWELFAQGR